MNQSDICQLFTAIRCKTVFDEFTTFLGPRRPGKLISFIEHCGFFLALHFHWIANVTELVCKLDPIVVQPTEGCTRLHWGRIGAMQMTSSNVQSVLHCKIVNVSICYNVGQKKTKLKNWLVTTKQLWCSTDTPSGNVKAMSEWHLNDKDSPEHISLVWISNFVLKRIQTTSLCPMLSQNISADLNKHFSLKVSIEAFFRSQQLRPHRLLPFFKRK